ncbi:MAG: hypothetical protein ACUVWJ_05570 [Spirochaetota bacterium]
MRKQELTLFVINTYVEESLATLKLAATTPEIGWLREKIQLEILKTPGPGMRKRIASEILRRYIVYDRTSGMVQKTPLAIFVSANIRRKSKIDGLYYRFSQVHPIVSVVFRTLRSENLYEFSFDVLSEILSVILSREINRGSTALHNIAYSLRDFDLVEKVKPGQFRIVEKILAPETFVFLLYTHFLSQNVIVPKTSEIKRFFKDLYNQKENETERLLFSSPSGFWDLDCNAHQDQVLLFYNHMDDFMKKFLEIYGDKNNNVNSSTKGSS